MNEHFGIIALLDKDLTHRIRELWKSVSEQGLGKDLFNSPVPPHITVYGFSTLLDSATLVERLHDLTQAAKPIPLRFSMTGRFLAPPHPFILVPSPVPELTRLRDRLYRTALPYTAHPRPYFETQEWMPHCTLAVEYPQNRLEQLQALIDAQITDGHSLSGTITDIAIARYSQDGLYQLRYTLPLLGSRSSGSESVPPKASAN
ncbi:2'-5' RNA ligase family protein [Spirochaeta lutea]|uniref:2'-5' RNA ligase n=1 Tax=Spirochaeta lutea TaxID=1480694 RepID=A0A098R2C7_9SPIO|nr:2'-5' RNA ligase family protein [Spirochaeta lutea]KGE72827.1 hypothetical protein DC28_05505 [Spirochaeta lutea]